MAVGTENVTTAELLPVSVAGASLTECMALDSEPQSNRFTLYTFTLMNKTPKWLALCLKVIGWMCLIPVCLVVLAAFIGWIGDLTASSKWQAGRQRAQERLQKLKTSEFASGFDFSVNQANAWDYYLKASASLYMAS